MDAKLDFFIEKLDSGFILEVDNRKEAITDFSQLKSRIENILQRVEIDFLKNTTRDILVQINVSTNLPKCVQQ